MDLIDVFQKRGKKTPCWFMRQAGRYLPEYKKLRLQEPNFIEFCLNPSLITEATLQPLQRFELDAAIIFSDILMIPYAVGQKVWFEENHGPCLEAYSENLDWNTSLSSLDPVYRGIEQVRKGMAPEKALIGFAGAPYTLACYMLEGKTSKTFAKAKTYGFSNSSKMDWLLDRLADTVILHLKNQIEAGCTVIQLFDSWASSVPDAFVERWLIKPTRKIVSLLHKTYPHIPIIAFPKDLGGWIPDYIKMTGINGISLSSSEKLETLLPLIPPNIVIQGALDPQLLVAGGKIMEAEIRRQLHLLKERRHIFNLGHGIVPETPPAHLAECIEIVKSYAE